MPTVVGALMAPMPIFDPDGPSTLGSNEVLCQGCGIWLS